jgi:hypothetical protein
MREAAHLRMLFNTMMLAHSVLVIQLGLYDFQILKSPKAETTRA